MIFQSIDYLTITHATFTLFIVGTRSGNCMFVLGSNFSKSQIDYGYWLKHADIEREMVRVEREREREREREK